MKIRVHGTKILRLREFVFSSPEHKMPQALCRRTSSQMSMVSKGVKIKGHNDMRTLKKTQITTWFIFCMRTQKMDFETYFFQFFLLVSSK